MNQLSDYPLEVLAELAGLFQPKSIPEFHWSAAQISAEILRRYGRANEERIPRNDVPDVDVQPSRTRTAASGSSGSASLPGQEQHSVACVYSNDNLTGRIVLTVLPALGLA